MMGPVVKPLVLQAVRMVADSFPDNPVIAAGGVETAADVLDLLAAGAQAVQVDVALWRDPTRVLKIARELSSGGDPRRAESEGR